MLCWCSLLVISGDAPHFMTYRQLARLLKKNKPTNPNIKTMCYFVAWVSRGFLGPFALVPAWKISSHRAVVCRKSSMACLCIQTGFQKWCRSKKKASDKAPAVGTRHINNLETAKCKNSPMQALKKSQGFWGEYSPRQKMGTSAGWRALSAWLFLSSH